MRLLIHSAFQGMDYTRNSIDMMGLIIEGLDSVSVSGYVVDCFLVMILLSGQM